MAGNDHKHLQADEVIRLIQEGRVEWLFDEDGRPLPAVRAVWQRRQWVKRLSLGLGAPVATMQLVQ